MAYTLRYTTLAKVRMLALAAGDALSDTELTTIVQWAERWVEDELNNGESLVTSSTATTETQSGRLSPSRIFVSCHYPIGDITSFTVDGVALTEGTNYYADDKSQGLLHLDGAISNDWQNAVLIYKFGYASGSIPAWLDELAAKKAAITVLNSVKKQEGDKAWWSERKQYENDIKDLMRKHKRVVMYGGY